MKVGPVAQVAAILAAAAQRAGGTDGTAGASGVAGDASTSKKPEEVPPHHHYQHGSQSGYFQTPRRNAKRPNFKAPSRGGKSRKSGKSSRGRGSSQVGEVEHDEDSTLDEMQEEEQRAQRTLLSRPPSFGRSNDDSEHGRQEENRGRQEAFAKRFKAPAHVAFSGGVAAPARVTGGDPTALLDWRNAATQTVARLMTTLHAPVKSAVPGAAPPRGDTAVAVAWALARAWAQRPADATTQPPACLADVRALLVEHRQAGARLPVAGHAATLWLPVFLLNLGRPRTDQDHRVGDARLQALQRAHRTPGAPRWPTPPHRIA